MSRNLPLATISIPTFNQEKYVGRAIESALAQTYPNLEVVVSDDGSTDRTFAIAQAYAGERVRIFKNERNLGRVGNYRHALYALARGEWVANLDGDDYYDDPDFIAAAIDRVTSNPGVVLCAAGYKVLHEPEGRLETAPTGLDQAETCMSGVDYVLGYPRLGLTQHLAIVYNRPLALETGFYLLDSLGTDTDSLCRLALKGKVYARRKPVGVWTHHDRNASYSLSEETAGKEIAMLEHIAEALAEHVPEPVWRQWLDQRVREKKRLVDNLMLARLPPAAAWSYLWRHKGLSLFHLKEAIKLVLRSLGLRRAPLCAE
ncbi:MAG: hypothetical protein QOH81_806 [Sphingomonadales bacterium]|jgi:glycosyltransferase involved in cell wall biosynthesis|nr:hypothetical protein [Sphingomonadales bacterium]